MPSGTLSAGAKNGGRKKSRAEEKPYASSPGRETQLI